MKTAKTILIFCICLIINGVVLSQASKEKITINQEKVEKLIKKIEKDFDLKKDYPKKEIFYRYPSQIEKGEFFTIAILWKEEEIFIIDYDPTTFEIKGVIDLR